MNQRLHSVLFLESSKNVGGQEFQLLQQINELRKLGWRVRLLCKPQSQIQDYAQRANIELATVAFRNALHLPSIIAVRRHIQEIQASTIILHSGHDAVVGALAARSLLGKRPGIIRMRTYQPGIPASFPYQYLFDHTFACSEHLRQVILSNKNISPDKIGVLYPGIDFEGLRISAQSSDLPIDIDAWLEARPGPLMVHGAMLRSEKGHHTILQALPKVLEVHPNLRYIIAGDGPLKEELKRVIRDRGLSDHVYLAGVVRPLAPLIRRASLAVLPSSTEPLGMFQIESIFNGIPTIASAVGGIPETIEHEKTGLLVNPEDISAWEQALIWALDHLPTMAEWTKEGKERNLKRFGIAGNTSQLIAAIENFRACSQ